MAKTSLPKINTKHKTCSISDCNNPSSVKGYCNAHYLRLRRYNRLNAVHRPKVTNFWDGIVRGEAENDCWQWKGARTNGGYGVFKQNKITYRAHCYSFFIHNEDWAKNQVLHSCDNPPCCNPLHLYDGTHADNTRDKIERSRQAKGEKCNQNKLKNEDIPVIRQLLAKKVTQKEIASKFGVDQGMISKIKNGKFWRHINESS